MQHVLTGLLNIHFTPLAVSYKLSQGEVKVSWTFSQLSSVLVNYARVTFWERAAKQQLRDYYVLFKIC